MKSESWPTGVMKLTLISCCSFLLNSSFRYLYEEGIGIAHLNSLGLGETTTSVIG